MLVLALLGAPFGAAASRSGARGPRVAGRRLQDGSRASLLAPEDGYSRRDRGTRVRELSYLVSCKTLGKNQPDEWARGEREGYGEPCDVTSLSLSLKRTVATSTINVTYILERDRADKEPQNLTYEVGRGSRHEQADGRL